MRRFNIYFSDKPIGLDDGWAVEGAGQRKERVKDDTSISSRFSGWTEGAGGVLAQKGLRKSAVRKRCCALRVLPVYPSHAADPGTHCMQGMNTSCVSMTDSPRED